MSTPKQDQAAASDSKPAAGALDEAMGDGVSSPGAGDSIAELRRELATEQDRALRLRAEMENLRSRTSRELGEQIKYASMPLARDIMPTIDNLDRALESATLDVDAKVLLQGVRMVREQLLEALARHHCTPIAAEGEPFDPQFHEAILQQPSETCPERHVIQSVQTGYRMHDRVVRASQVIVSSGPPTKKPS